MLLENRKRKRIMARSDIALKKFFKQYSFKCFVSINLVALRKGTLLKCCKHSLAMKLISFPSKIK